ncbi:CinA family nicotinamide mononucleotide deamidase-related protein [Chloroflexota bacterium]
MRAEIVPVGTELLLGETTDTNACYLASELPLLGIDLHWISMVGDNQARLVDVLRRAWRRSELILTSGGLGPTEDDLTREAIAETLGEKLRISLPLEKELRDRFIDRGITMPLSNLRQANIIPSARPVFNAWGTAPGWWVEKESRLLVAMPGPPDELQEMWQKEVRPRLQQGSRAVILRRTFKTFGLPEAAVGELVSSLISRDNPGLGVYAKADGIHLRMVAKAGSQEGAEKILTEGEANIRKFVGEYIWGVDDDTLETTVARRLIERGLTLAFMEDYSGGWLTASITDIPESREFFKGGLVAHSNEAKVVFGVGVEIISRYGAVSPEVAQAMAEAARTFLGADIGIGITGTDGASSPTGAVYISVVDGKDGRIGKIVHRPRWKRRITTTALFELRRLLIQNG